MNQASGPFRIHDNYKVWFRTLGNTLQTRVSLITTEHYTDQDRMVMIEPGRTILIGDIDEELLKLFNDFGKPTLNTMTSLKSRPGGIFSTRSYESIKRHLYGANADQDAPRVRPDLRNPRPQFRDAVTAVI